MKTIYSEQAAELRKNAAKLYEMRSGDECSTLESLQHAALEASELEKRIDALHAEYEKKAKALTKEIDLLYKVAMHVQ